MRRLAPTLLLALAACGDAPAPRPSRAASHVDPAAVEAFRAAQAAEAERTGLPASFTAEFGLRFELVPGGEWVMGSPRGESGRADDETSHEVRIVQPYYVGAREVPPEAVAAWRGAVGASGEGAPTGPTHADAVAFAAWLSARDPRWNFRLPTEAEWEHAARTAGTAGAMEGGATGPWEWCSDRYGPYPDWYVTHPAGDERGEERVLRGGEGARVAQRRHLPPTARAADLGLRLVAPPAYGKADAGRVVLDLRSVDTGEGGEVLREVEGFEVRVITVLDRLSARQAGMDLVWHVLPGRRTPTRWHVPPGRYYVQCQVPGSEEERGVEIKVDADRPEVTVHLPTPHAGATLPKPQ